MERICEVNVEVSVPQVVEQLIEVHNVSCRIAASTGTDRRCSRSTGLVGKR